MKKIEYAAHRGVDPSAVTKAIRDGRISVVVVNGKELIDPAIADVEWKKNTNEAYMNEQENRKRNKIPETVDDLETQEGELKSPGNKPPSYSDSRAYREALNVKMKHLEYLQKTGRLVDADEVKREQFNSMRALRDTLLTIPDRIHAQACAITDPQTMHAFLTKEIVKTLESYVDSNQR